VALIGCSKTKTVGTRPARDLYTGQLFKAALAHAERTADVVLILSARHGLLSLDTEVESYDEPLRAASNVERNSWAYRVVLDLRQRMRGRRYEVFIYAGRTYAEPFEHYLAMLGGDVAVTAPLDGLSIGQQLSWFRCAARLVGGAHAHD